MKVLWVTSVFPDPEGSKDAAREFELLRALGSRHDIMLITTDWGVRSGALQATKEVASRVEVVPWRVRRGARSPSLKLARLLLGAAPSFDAWMRSASHEPAAAVLAAEDKRVPADVVQIFGGELAPIMHATRAPAALLLSSSFSNDARDLSRSTRLPRSIRYRLERRNAEAWERRWYGSADWLACVPSPVAKGIGELIGRNVQVIPDPIETPEEAAASLEQGWLRITRGREIEKAPPMSAPEALTPSVVICTRERPELLRRCLAGMREAVARAPSAEVIIVEQGVPSAAAICAELGLVATIVADEGRGATRARNEGVRRARGDVIFFTDDDCEVPEDWIGAHLEAIAAGATGSFGPVAGMSRTDEIYDPATLPASHRSDSPPWLIGHSANMAVRTSALRAVNGFDERLGPGTSGIGGDDADLMVRLLRAGYVLRSGTGATVRHMDWRSSEANRENLIAYEHGAGRWIGKTFREQPRAALSFLALRIELIRNRDESGRRSVSGRQLAGALARGLASGFLMGPWRGRRG